MKAEFNKDEVLSLAFAIIEHNARLYNNKWYCNICDHEWKAGLFEDESNHDKDCPVLIASKIKKEHSHG